MVICNGNNVFCFLSSNPFSTTMAVFWSSLSSLYYSNTVIAAERWLAVPCRVLIFYLTSGFWPRMRARALRAPVFLGSLPCPTGRFTPPPAYLSFAAPPKIKLFPETKCIPSGPNSGRQGRIFFHWVKLYPTELRCTFLSCFAPYLSCAAP